MRGRTGVVSALVVAGALLGAPAAFARDGAITSFDGTNIVLHYFPAAGLSGGAKAPTVLFGPGWSSPGETDPNSQTDVTLGYVGVGTLRKAGYNVLTWDPRGFGSSGGTVTVNSPDNERRDVQGLLDYVAKQPESQLDSAGDPRAGMTGGSYGGEIQLLTAAFDSRLDAIVPDIAWHSLIPSLYKDRTLKEGWSAILFATGHARGRLDSHIDSSFVGGGATGALSNDDYNWFLSRGPGDLVKQIKIPTFLIQGTVDTLFTLGEATTNYGILRSRVPVKMLWFCGGHGTCLTNPGDTGKIERRTLAWLDRYLRGNKTVDTGPRFEWLDQDGKPFAASDWPPTAAGSLTGSGSGTLPVSQTAGSGPSQPGSTEVGGLGAPTNGSRAAVAVNVTIPAPKAGAEIAGAPQVQITYTGTASPAATKLYGQVVDDETNRVLGNLVTPIPVTLDGARHTVTRPLEIVSATAKPGRTFTVQITPSAVPYDRQRATGFVTLSKVDASLPVVAPSLAPADSQGCVNARGGVHGKRLGPARMGRTRKAQRGLLKGARLHSRRGIDRYCASGGGSFRIAYPKKRLGPKSHVALVLTSSKRFSVRRVKAGMKAKTARRRMKPAARIHIGRNNWLVGKAKHVRLLVQMRGGKVRAVGVARKKGRAGRLLRAWNLS
jgi:ABC-2 type transport system ATP-binding protein